MDYQTFLESKAQLGSMSGFEPLWIPDFLFDFQRYLVEWAIGKGRSAIFADCGLGKTPLQLVWAENVVRYTNRPVLILTPLAVAGQTIREAEKFGIAAVRSKDGVLPRDARIVVTNYDQIHKYNPDDFSGAVGDESGGIKHFDAKRTALVTEFFRTLPYRLLCTATPAPNDFDELGTSAEALGEMGYQDMLTRFFKKGVVGGHLRWTLPKNTLKPHAEGDFWRWVCSWARACRKPSDLGFDDGPFVLPPLETAEHVVQSRRNRPGCLFDLPAKTLPEQREERRRTIPERCEHVAALVNDRSDPSVAWCHLNDEGDLLTRLIPDAVQVSGTDPDDLKEAKFIAFSEGRVRVLVTKPIIAAWGLNWQHCAHQTFFPSHSFEQWYQAVRRSWRFGQGRTVQVDVIASEGEAGVLENLKRKSEAADHMFDMIVSLMNDPLSIRRSVPFTAAMQIPPWLDVQQETCCGCV